MCAHFLRCLERLHVLFLVALAVAVSSRAANAQAFGLTSVTGSLGLASPEVIGSTFHVAARADVGQINEKWGIDAGLHFWKKSYQEYDDFSGTTAESFRDLALTSGVKYKLAMDDPGLVPYARAGLGLHFEGASTGYASGGRTDVGLYLGGGVEYRVASNVSVGADLSYHMLDIDQLLLGAQVSYALGR
jgi:hypothetical protein